MLDRRMNVCPVCGTAKWKVVYCISQWEIGECGVCGFARIDPLPIQKDRAEFYNKEKVVNRNEKQKTLVQKFSRNMKRFFNRCSKRNKGAIFFNKLSHSLPPSSKILDIGCGDGSFLKLAKKKFICFGIEISEYLADLARRQGDIKIRTGDFLKEDFFGEKYDGITLISLLEHLDDPRMAIEKCYDLLNDNGILLLKTVNYGCLNRKIKKQEWTGFRPPDHIVYFTPSNLKRLLEKTGFQGVKVSAQPFNDNMYCDARKREAVF